MKNFTIISASDLLNMPRLSEEEMKAERAKEMAAYRKMLRGICPSKETRQEARRIAKRDDSCDKCVYRDGETWICHYPHSDSYMEDLDIDPCYEGVLRFLAKEAEEQARLDAIIEGYIVSELMDELKSAIDIAYNNMEIIRDLCRWLLKIADENWKMPLAAVNMVRELNDLMDGALPPESGDPGDGGRQ